MFAARRPPRSTSRRPSEVPRPTFARVGLRVALSSTLGVDGSSPVRRTSVTGRRKLTSDARLKNDLLRSTLRGLRLSSLRSCARILARCLALSRWCVVNATCFFAANAVPGSTPTDSAELAMSTTQRAMKRLLDGTTLSLLRESPNWSRTWERRSGGAARRRQTTEGDGEDCATNVRVRTAGHRAYSAKQAPWSAERALRRADRR